MATTALKIKEKTQHVMPYLVALTILYSIVYHIILFGKLQQEATEDECADAAYSGGIFPPHCFELEVFRDWHKKEAEELLAPEVEAPQQDNTMATTYTGAVAMVVDEVGQVSFADKISEELLGLENHFAQLLDSSIYLDVKKHEETQIAKYKDDPTEKKTPTSLRVETAPLTSWQKNLDAVQEKVHQELHADLDKLESVHNQETTHTTKGVKSFETFHAELEARHKRRAENRARLVREVALKMDALDKNLLDVVSDRKAWESTLRMKDDVTIHTEDSQKMEAQPQTSFMSKRLQWSMPTIRHKRKVSEFLEASKKQAMIVSKNDVRHMQWTGKLPKVAAIASIKGDRKHKARMMYFVDNFKLQTYEGEKELVLVYHFKDTLAAELVNRYANDRGIKGVVAHDKSQDMFPSDPALRYAAWASDADVIAQWDVDEYHDPNRLSLQVRAMAYANRHACVLSTTSTSHSQEEEENKELHSVSLIGERSWMKEHWHPLREEEESEVVDTFKAGEIVELDMQNKALMGNISRIEHIFTETTTVAPGSQDIESKDQSEGSDFSHGIEECLGYDHTKGHESEDVAEKAITEKAGEDVGKKFHNLVKRRRDIIMKLQLLCFQATMEKDAGKRKFMHDHVLEMDQIRVDLDQHITNTASLFAGGI